MTTGVNSEVSVWSRAGAGELTRVATLASSPLSTWRAVLSPSPDAGLIAAGSGKGAIHFLRITDGSDGMAVEGGGHASSSSSLTLSQASPSVSSRGGAFALGVAFSPDGKRLAAGHADGSVSLVDVERGVLTGTIDAHALCVRSVAWSHDGRELLTASDDGRVGVFDVGGGAGAAAPLVCHLAGHTGFVSCVLPGPLDKPGSVLSGSADKSVRVWDARRRECAHVFEGHAGTVWALAALPGMGGAGETPGARRVASVSEAGTLAMHGLAGVA